VGPEEFRRALITVLVAGSIIIGIGATAVVLTLRGFGKKAGSTKHVLLIVGMIAFIFLCCLGLFLLSYFER